MEKSTVYEIDSDDIELHAVNADCGIVGIRLTRSGRSDSEMIHISSSIMKRLKDNVRICGAVQAYVRLLLDGDPENEDPNKVLETIWEMIESQNKEVTA